MRRWQIVLMGLIGLAALRGSAQESLSAEQLQRLKAATVYIKVQAGPSGVASGSGFLIRVDGPDGLVITNHHVIETALPAGSRLNHLMSLKPGSKIEAVFDSGTPHDRSLPAIVLGIDPERDLAVLRVKSGQNFPQPLDLQNAPKLRETLPVFICGFPFGDALSQAKNPEITITPATVSAIRLTPTGQVQQVQLNGNLNSGNSGGPVVTADGKLIGVARATIKGTGIGLAIPQHEVSLMLQGRTGSVQLSRTPGKTGFRVSATLIDPLRQVEAATLHYQEAEGKLPVSAPDSPAELLPDSQAVPMNLGQDAVSVDLESPSEEPRWRVQIQLKTKSGAFVTHPVDLSLSGSGGKGTRPEELGPPTTELPDWLKELLLDRVPQLPKRTETLPPTAPGTVNLTDFAQKPALYAGQTIQVNALTNGNLTERTDGYELETHSGSGRPPAGVRIIIPADLACQVNDLVIEPEDSYAIRLIGKVEKPQGVSEVRHTLYVQEMQFLAATSGTPAVTLRPESRSDGKVSLGRINRFPIDYVGQSFNMVMIFRNILTIRGLTEVDVTNYRGSKPINLEFYASKALAEQAEDELRGGSRLVRVSFKVERVSSRNGKGILGVNKIELLDRDGRVTKTLSTEEDIIYPAEAKVFRGPIDLSPRPKATGPPSGSPNPPPTGKVSNGLLIALMIGGIVFVLMIVLVGVGVYFLLQRKKASGRPAPTTPAELKPPSGAGEFPNSA